MHYSISSGGRLGPHGVTVSPTAPKVIETLAPSERAGANSPPRILIVEDDYFVAIDLEHRLKEAGFAVVGVAACAEEALELAATEKPVLALMDIRIAGARDGIETAIELQKSFGIPSIFATAHGDEATRKRAEEAQPRGWLQKPYSSAALIEAVRSALT